MMLTLLNACDGHQQTAQLMAYDIVAAPLPIASGPKWGRSKPRGLGVEVDETKLARYHQDFLDYGEFPPCGDKFSTDACSGSDAPNSRGYCPGPGRRPVVSRPGSRPATSAATIFAEPWASVQPRWPWPTL